MVYFFSVVSRFVAVGGFMLILLSLFISGSIQVATGEDRKRIEKQAKQAETAGKILSAIGVVGLIVTTLINSLMG